jgi:hypothetical protein
LHVSASASGTTGTITDAPTDKSAGAVFTGLSSSAAASNPNGAFGLVTASSSGSSNMLADAIAATGSCSGTGGAGRPDNIGSGSGEALITATLASDSDLLVALGTNSNLYFHANLAIRNSSNQTVQYYNSPFGEFYGPGLFSHYQPLTLPAGQYTFDFSYSGGVAVGTGGSGGGGFQAIPAPEPGSASLAMLGLIAIRRHRRSADRSA